MTRFETFDVQNSSEDKIAEALTLMAIRSHVPAKTIIAERAAKAVGLIRLETSWIGSSLE